MNEVPKLQQVLQKGDKGDHLSIKTRKQRRTATNTEDCFNHNATVNISNSQPINIVNDYTSIDDSGNSNLLRHTTLYTLDYKNNNPGNPSFCQHQHQFNTLSSVTPPQLTPPLQDDEQLQTTDGIEHRSRVLHAAAHDLDENLNKSLQENNNVISQKYVQLDESNIIPVVDNQRYSKRRRCPQPKPKFRYTNEDTTLRSTRESQALKTKPVSNKSLPTVKASPSTSQSINETELSTSIASISRIQFEKVTDKSITAEKPSVKTTRLYSISRKSNSSRNSTKSQNTSSGSKNTFEEEAAYVLYQNIYGSSPQLFNEHLIVSDILIGEGQFGAVYLATYKGVEVACKMKREKTHHAAFESQAIRELQFAAKLSVCRYVNRYIGWIYCHRHLVEESKAIVPKNGWTQSKPRLYIVQKYVPNGDARNYLNKRMDLIQPLEVLQAAICLFSTLADAHSLNIGLVDLKLENFLIDPSGSGWVTDFGSCIEFKEGHCIAKLDEEGVSWTKTVAAPEMLKDHEFCKASDVFMATLIIAELMTAELSDSDFYHGILGRNRQTGRVNFSSALIDMKFKHFFYLLKVGLSNEPSDRPTANDILNCLLNMRV